MASNIDVTQGIKLRFDEQVEVVDLLISPPIDENPIYRVDDEIIKVDLENYADYTGTINIQLVAKDRKGNYSSIISLLYSTDEQVAVGKISGQIISIHNLDFAKLIAGAFNRFPFPLADSSEMDYDALVSKKGEFTIEGISPMDSLWLAAYQGDKIVAFPSTSVTTDENVTLFATNLEELRIEDIKELPGKSCLVKLNRGVMYARAEDENLVAFVNPSNSQQIFLFPTGEDIPDSINVNLEMIINSNWVAHTLEFTARFGQPKDSASILNTRPIYTEQGIMMAVYLTCPVLSPTFFIKEDEEEEHKVTPQKINSPVEYILPSLFKPTSKYQIRIKTQRTYTQVDPLPNLGELDISVPDTLAFPIHLMLISDSTHFYIKLTRSETAIPYFPAGKYFAMVFQDRYNSGCFLAGGRNTPSSEILYYQKDIYIRRNWITELAF